MPAPQTLPSFATVIHLGAGKGERLEEFRDRGAQRIILLEPAAGAAKALERRAAGRAGTRVIHAAASARDGQAELHLWNLPRLNSLAPASPQMHDLYPGLRQRARQPVRLLSPRSLLAETGETGEIERPLLLVVETPGSERDTLEGWKADGLLDQVDQIELHCAEEALYEGAATRAELEAWLTDEGFAVTLRDCDDPDWTILHLRADHAARALERAQAEIAGHLETIARQKKNLEAREAALRETAERVAAMEKALAETRAEAEEKAKALTARDAALRETSERVSALKKALAQIRAETEEKAEILVVRDAALQKAAARADELERSLTQSRVETEEKEETLAARDAALEEAAERVEALEKALTERDVALAEARGQAEKHAARLEEEQASHVQAYGERDKALADLGLALRMQGLLQSDLDDLRERYRRSEETRARQEALLRKLTPRLQEAAHQLRQLQLVEPDAAPGIAATGTARAESPGPARAGRGRAARKKSIDAG